MEYLTLKNSDLNVSRLCIGGCPIGGHGWGQVDRDELISTVRESLDNGLNFFDTADVYGLGESESILGQTLADRRDDIVIATKFGVRFKDGKTYYDNSPAWIEEAVTGSLKRLNMDCIDLYQMHYRDGITPVSEVVAKLEELKQRGLVRYFGLSNIYKKDIDELAPYASKIVSFQDEYSLAKRSHEADIMEAVDRLDITPMTWGSLGQGVLSGKYSKDSTFGSDDRRSREIYTNFHGKKFEHNLQIVEKMREISTQIGKELPAIAIRWILDYMPESVVIAGVKNRKQLSTNADALGWHLQESHIQQLDNASVWNED